MRVAYLTAGFGVPVLGAKGPSAHARGFLEALRSQGHDLFVLTANIGDDADPSFPPRHVLFGSTLMKLVPHVSRRRLALYEALDLSLSAYRAEEFPEAEL